MSGNDYGTNPERVAKMKQVITKERHVDTKEYRGKNKGIIYVSTVDKGSVLSYY